MKTITLSIFTIVLCQLSFAADKAKIVFQETEYVMRDSYLGETSEHVFVFKNEGTAPLIVTNAVPSCGCVTPTFTKIPVAPGDTGSIHVYYEGKMSGIFHKTIKIYSNSVGKKPILQISGETKKKTTK
ncbi:MAG: DUF1573 domain-containing protein [Bacteroidales bacterium]|nr:DUF1573 domain-containing protein [Bacteroidales bacterium]